MAARSVPCPGGAIEVQVAPDGLHPVTQTPEARSRPERRRRSRRRRSSGVRRPALDAGSTQASSGARVLGHIGERLAGHEVHGRLACRTQPQVERPSMHLHRNRAATGQLREAPASPDPVEDPGDAGHRPARPAHRGRSPAGRAPGRRGPATAAPGGWSTSVFAARPSGPPAVAQDPARKRRSSPCRSSSPAATRRRRDASTSASGHAARPGGWRSLPRGSAALATASRRTRSVVRCGTVDEDATGRPVALDEGRGTVAVGCRQSDEPAVRHPRRRRLPEQPEADLQGRVIQQQSQLEREAAAAGVAQVEHQVCHRRATTAHG